MAELRPVNLFEPLYRTEECLEELRSVLDSGWTAPGEVTRAFEREWREYTGLPNAHFVSSATAGLHLALRVLGERLGWREGEDVITTPLTFVSTNHAILYERLFPIFADVDEHLCLNPEDVEYRWTSRARAVVFVGLGGNPGRLADVAETCRRRGAALILDAAHMAGTRLGERHVGHEADASVFSFQGVKNCPAGDGGMVCFNNDEDDARARVLSWMGIDRDTHSRATSGGSYKWRYDVGTVGFKYAGNAVAATLGRVALRHLDDDNLYRRALAAVYDATPVGRLAVPTAAGADSSRHLYQVLVDERDRVLERLNEQRVYPGVHYVSNLHYAPYRRYVLAQCPRAEDASRRALSLPLHCRMTADDAARVARALQEAL